MTGTNNGWLFQHIVRYVQIEAIWPGGEYNPDFLIIGADNVHWIVEVKADKDLPSAEVQGKRETARRWANHVNAAAKVTVAWRYLLVSESDVTEARGSWPALRALGS